MSRPTNWIVALLLLAFAALAHAADPAYDLVLRNARVVDGTGSPWFRADIAVRGDTIVKIAPAILEPSRPGMKADLAVFDPAVVKDMATYDKPHQYAMGFEYVVVNGAVVFEGGAMTGERPRRVLYGVGRGN